MGATVTVLYNQNLSDLNLPDGVVFDVTDPQSGTAQPNDGISSVCYVGTAVWGPMDTLTQVGGPTEALQTIGPQQVQPNDLMTQVSLALQMGVTDVRMVRVGSGSETAAQMPLMAANGAFMTLVGLYYGSYINGATAVFTYSPLTPATMMKTNGNPQKVYVDLTIIVPNAPAEVYHNLDGNVASPTIPGDYNISPTVLAAAVVAAVNNGQPDGQVASTFFVASAGGVVSSGAPIIGTPNTVTVLGTDGTDFGVGTNNTLDAAMLGSNQTLPFTGLFAASGGINGSAVSLVGCNDVSTVGPAFDTFCKQNNGHAIMAYPNGTPSLTAIGEKNLTGIADWSITLMAGDFAEIIDPVNGGITRFVDPCGVAAAQMALTPFERSPANLPISVIIGTFRTGTQQNQPYSGGSGGEINLLENAGINFLSNDTAGGVGFAIAHNKNSLGKTAGYRGNIAYGRTIQYLIVEGESLLLGQYVGQDQGFSRSDDSVRAAVRALSNDFFDELGDRIDGFTITCDQTNNFPGTGILRCDWVVQQKEIIDNVAIGLTTGGNVLSQVTPLPAVSAAT